MSFTSTEHTIILAAANLLLDKGSAITAEHDPLATHIGFLGQEAHETGLTVARLLRSLKAQGLIEA